MHLCLLPPDPSPGAAGHPRGAARVAAHVHHTQDIVAALIIGLVAAAAATVLWRQVVKPRLTGSLRRITG